MTIIARRARAPMMLFTAAVARHYHFVRLSFRLTMTDDDPDDAIIRCHAFAMLVLLRALLLMLRARVYALLRYEVHA